MQTNSRYAKTLFNLCIKSNCIGLIQGQLKSIAYLFHKVSAFRLVLITKRINNQNKLDIIAKTLINFNPLVIEFLSIIISNNQSNNMLDIISRFNHLVNLRSNVQSANIITAYKLEDAEIQSLTKSIHSTLNTKPKIDISTNSDMIGGMKLRIGNKIFDNSISYKINHLKKILYNM